jgi:hypothetical protein
MILELRRTQAYRELSPPYEIRRDRPTLGDCFLKRKNLDQRFKACQCLMLIASALAALVANRSGFHRCYLLVEDH